MGRIEDLVAAITSLEERVRAHRLVLGIVGPPGVGKSTVAAQLVAQVTDAALLPLDGFHLAQTTLRRLGLASRKGAPQTFDGAGFAAALARVRRGEDVYVPRFDRDLDDAIAGALLVPAAARLVVVEGNYLLLDTAPWPSAAAQLDETWYLELDEAVRVERLIARHMRFGRSRPEAEAWAAKVDGPNAALIAACRDRADLVVRV